MKKQQVAFTLVEILLWVLIVSMVLTVALTSLSSLWIGKVKLVEKVFLEKHVFSFQEKFFETIKKSWVVDYEEYFNRSVYDSVLYSSWHYEHPSGFWNFGSAGSIGTTTYGGSYLCRSPSWTQMGTGWCLSANFNTLGLSQWGVSQKYGSYKNQFIDYNSDIDANGGTPWDENTDGDIKNDDDDEYIWVGPQVFTGWVFQRELYLISASGDERTYFRRSVSLDPDAPATEICDFSIPQNPIGSACLGTIEFLKLQGKDYGEDHDISILDLNKTQFDGKIDTWLIHPDFLSDGNPVVGGSNNNSYWQPLFADTVNVKDLQFFIYPHKNPELSWKDNDPNILVAPYIRVNMQLSPSRSIKRKIKWQVPVIPLSTTIHLNDLLSN